MTSLRTHLNRLNMEPDTAPVEANLVPSVSETKEDAPPTLAEPASGPVVEMSGALPTRPTAEPAPATGMIHVYINPNILSVSSFQFSSQ